MSRATKRKHVLMEVLQDDYSPPQENQEIVKVLNSRGNNLHEVETVNGTTYLCSMPTKFRKNVWIKRGDYVLVEPIEEGDKVKAEIVRILTNTHIRYFKKDKIWPSQFNNDKSKEDSSEEDLFVNTNRRQLTSGESSDESDSESDLSDADNPP